MYASSFLTGQFTPLTFLFLLAPFDRPAFSLFSPRAILCSPPQTKVLDETASYLSGAYDILRVPLHLSSFGLATAASPQCGCHHIALGLLPCLVIHIFAGDSVTTEKRRQRLHPLSGPTTTTSSSPRTLFKELLELVLELFFPDSILLFDFLSLASTCQFLLQA